MESFFSLLREVATFMSAKDLIHLEIRNTIKLIETSLRVKVLQPLYKQDHLGFLYGWTFQLR